MERNELALQSGMTFPVEGAIHLRARGGVGIEDNVMVTEEGDKTLATLPSESMRAQERSEARSIRGLQT